MSDSTRKTSDEAADSALRNGLRSRGLSPEALQRIRQATEAEWRSTVAQAQPVSPRRSNWFKFAAAASVILLAGAGVIGVIGYNNQSDAGMLVATVARSEAPGIELRQVLRADEPMPAGADLRVFARLEVRGDTLLKLAGGGNLRVARGSSFDIPDANTVRLASGELYVDIPPGARGSEPFIVVTSAGQFRHVGTQFGVAIVGGKTRLRVREGSVLWHAAGGDQTVHAGTEVIMDGREISRRAIPTAGRDWAWAETLVPEIVIENRPLQEFLTWFSRETGRKLVLTDDAARRQVAGILMHGNVRGLTAMEALSAVMAATTLHYELPEGAIRVSSTRASAPSS
ncbi:MAG TPA: FecR domain-containing protein [Steroidobacteraceae bacterium]|nr:FecR domain-containing protein [Steroidobacteraceae bacterium]